MDFEEVLPRRSLGSGHWDKRLKERMIELSVADNYDDCKHEWIVTGETWYIPFGEEANMVLPDVHCEGDSLRNHPHECLCGHPIVWHFEIENTETGQKNIVGSEHIESYMVIRHLVEDKGYDPTTITEEMIDQWVGERIKALKAKWWWDLHGEQFEEWFAAVADLDLRVNVRKKGNRYDQQTRRYEPEYVIRKRAEGTFGMPGYKMASITWRWNNPNNSRRQIDTRGYPNERLWNDLQIFYIMMQQHQANIDAEDARRNNRLNELAEQDRQAEERRKKRQEAWEEERRQLRIKEDIQRKADAELDGVQEQKRLNRAIAARMNQDSASESFIDACEYYDIPVFNPQMAGSSWERSFLSDMIRIMSEGRDLSERQLERLRNIVVDEPLPATDRQKWYLRKLDENVTIPDDMTRVEASKLIELLKERNEGGE